MPSDARLLWHTSGRGMRAYLGDLKLQTIQRADGWDAYAGSRRLGGGFGTEADARAELERWAREGDAQAGLFGGGR